MSILKDQYYNTKTVNSDLADVVYADDPKEFLQNVDNSIQYTHYKLEDSLKRVMLTTYCMNERKPIVFDSESAEKFRNIYEIVAASAAAPAYFAPVKIPKHLNSHKDHSLIDGGMSLANPALHAVLHSLDKVEDIRKDFVVVSIGTGRHEQMQMHDTVKDWGPVQWLLGDSDSPAMMMTSVIFDAQSDSVDQQLEEMIGAGYFRIQVNLPHELHQLDNGDPAFIQQLKDKAEEWVDSTEGQQALGLIELSLRLAGKVPSAKPPKNPQIQPGTISINNGAPTPSWIKN